MTKMILFATLLGVAGASAAPERFTCNLSVLTKGERARDHELMMSLAAAVQEKKELPDGYAFRFDRAKLPELAEWTNIVAKCCQPLTYQIELGPQPGGGGIGIARQEDDPPRRRAVRAVDPGAGAHEPVVRLHDEEAATAADDPPALAQHELDHPRVAALRGQGARPGGRLDRRELDDPSLGLADRLVGDHHDIAGGERRRRLQHE